MPPLRVTRKTPMHIILIADDSGSMREDGAFEHANEGIQQWVLELQLMSKAQKDHFWLSMIIFGTQPRIHGEYLKLHDIDAEYAPITGQGGSTDMAAAFCTAIEILERHPPKATDCPPFIFLYTDGQADDEKLALQAAQALKNMPLPCGKPTVVTIGLKDASAAFLQQAASRPELYLFCPDSGHLANLLPAVGTMVFKHNLEDAHQKIQDLRQKPKLSEDPGNNSSGSSW